MALPEVGSSKLSSLHRALDRSNEDLARTLASITFLMFVCRPVENPKYTNSSLNYSATSLFVQAPFRLLKGRHALTLFINKYFLQIE